MHRFKNILAVYHDDIGADNVFAHATALARENGARLTLIDVVPDRYATPYGLEERGKRLDRLLPAIKAEGINDAHVIVFSGSPFLEIVRQVLREHHDIVMISPESSAALHSYYYGSTAKHLVRKCPCPVLIVGPDQAVRYQNILACIDPKSDNEAEHELDRKIVDLATSLADTNGAELHIVHVWDIEGKDLDKFRSDVPDVVRDSLLSKHKGLHRGRVVSLLGGHPASEVDMQLHLPRGQPYREIVKLVDEQGIDLIVMGSVNRTGIAGFLIGSEAETILASVRCGVLAVKPEGFRTPVVLTQTRRHRASAG